MALPDDALTGPWLEIPAPLGSYLWSVLAPKLGSGLSVYETISDPEGHFGRPTMLTTVGIPGGRAPLLKCVTKKDHGDEDWTERHYYVPDAQGYVTMLAEAEAVLANEQGMGDPPDPGWVWRDGAWRDGLWIVTKWSEHAPDLRWQLRHAERPGARYHPTARAGMLARRSEPA